MTASRSCMDGPCLHSLNRELSCHINGCKYSNLILNLVLKGYGSWTNWSACSKSCGNGQMTSSRACIDGPCSLSLSRELSCHLDGCEFS